MKLLTKEDVLSHKVGKQYCEPKKLKEVLNDFKKVHGDKYDYSLVDYKNNRTKVKIICQKHGVYEQRPDSHLMGRGCKLCGRENIRSEDYFKNLIKRFNKVHSKKYTYKNLKSIQNVTDSLQVVCEKHGEFNVRVSNHLRGDNCPKCSLNNKPQNNIKSKESLLKEFKNIHNETYEYNLKNYKGVHSKIDIICKKHGEFKQTVNHHLQGCGCPKCSHFKGSSKQEKELFKFIKTINSTAENNNRTVLEGTELDIYIKERNLAIEYNGVFWHSEKYKDKNYHYEKWRQCDEKGIQLIQIFEDDWINKKDLVKSFLKSKLGVFDRKINARDCEVREVPKDVYKKFTNNNHLQGYVNGSYYLGLYFGEDLISVMSLKKIKEKEFDLNRFCSKRGYLVRGGFSKIFKNFIKHYNPKIIISFSDNTYSDGNLYFKNKFEKTQDIKPDYKYIINNSRKHKFGFRKKKLQKMFNLSDQELNNKTEHQICLENNILRIYDAGKQKFEFKINQ
ncbi:MAG: hypothetical protein KC414_03825 [Romboutsia sp.]|nr:hypothetical protein [Romboutsia sp.]